MNKDKFRLFAPVDFLEKAKDKKGNEVLDTEVNQQLVKGTWF